MWSDIWNCIRMCELNDFLTRKKRNWWKPSFQPHSPPWKYIESFLFLFKKFYIFKNVQIIIVKEEQINSLNRKVVSERWFEINILFWIFLQFKWYFFWNIFDIFYFFSLLPFFVFFYICIFFIFFYFEIFGFFSDQWN